MVNYQYEDTKAWDYQINVNKEQSERLNRVEDKLDKTNNKLNSLTILVILSLLINIVEFPQIYPMIKALISFLISL